MIAPAFALVALPPLAIGSPPPSAAIMRVTLCSGEQSRTVEIPIPGRMPAMPPPCPAKACHAGCNRKQFDSSQ